MAGTLRLKQIRSGIGFNKNQRVVLQGLGIRRMGHEVEVPDTPQTRGMVLKVRHLLTVNGVDVSVAKAK